MPVPDFQSLFRPFLDFAKDGKEKNINDAIAAMSDWAELTDEERAQTVPSGKQSLIANRTHWTRTYMDKAGAVTKIRRSHFRITDIGLYLLENAPERITNKDLKQFQGFVEFHKPKPKSEIQAENETLDSDQDAKTPEERIELAANEIEEALRSNLLDRILEETPEFFERLVVDLIVGMGYGGSRDSVARRIGRSGDEGIDGIINEDPLGLDVVYVQAKRYNPENSIGREKIQQFSGALMGQGAQRGVFVTTSSFTSGAREYAEKVPQRIILIDGDELTSLMLRYGVGVRTERSYPILRMDADYFSTD